jgi:hypothetical protein
MKVLSHQYIFDEENLKDDLSSLKYKFEVKSLYEPINLAFYFL